MRLHLKSERKAVSALTLVDVGRAANATLGREFLVRGRVQGVGFRAATQREAMRLGLVGHAHNLPDGAVRVRAFGSDSALDALAQFLAQGPRFARVDAVTHTPIAPLTLDASAPQRFSTGTES